MSGKAESNASREEPRDDTPLHAALGEFLYYNPEAELGEREGESVVTKPWGEKSISFLVTEDDTNLTRALNQVRLPPRFTAIWHRDSRDLEVIFTALGGGEKYLSRSFTFRFEGDEFTCEYGRSSDRLLTIAEATEFSGQYHFDDRNLHSYKLWTRHQDSEEFPDSNFRDATPVSFWIRAVERDEEELVGLARHINFYMRLHDRLSPVILIHEAEQSRYQDLESVQFPTGGFPEVIVGHQVDSYLLSLWESARTTGDVVKTYLHYYQVLEYASHYHIQDEVYRQVSRLLREPSLHNKPEEFARKTIDILTADERHRTHKFEATIRDLVRPQPVWQVVDANKEYFAQQISFDGGFRIEPLVRDGWGFEDFQTAWLPRFPNTVREIRNALVHAREQQQADVISPSSRNSEKLRPWLEPLKVAAERVILQWKS